MPWDLNQINSTFMGNLPQYGEAFQAGVDESQQRRVAQTLFAQAQALAAAKAKALKEGTREAYAALDVLDPKNAEAYQRAVSSLDQGQRDASIKHLSLIHGYLDSASRPGTTAENRQALIDKAAAAQQRYIESGVKAGHDMSGEQDMLDLIKTDPDGFRETAKYNLYGLLPDDQKAGLFKTIGEEQRASDAAPGEIAKTEAETGKTVAETAKINVETQYAPDVIKSEIAAREAQSERWRAQTQNEIGNLQLGWANNALDKDKLTTETQLKLEEYRQKGQEVAGASLDELTKSVGSSQQNQALAERTTGLADQIAASDMRGAGWRSFFAETAKSSFGNQDPVSGLRAQYNQLINSQAVKNLPPGSASDKDIAIAKQGFPPSDAGKDYLVQFLRGMAKMQTVAAQADDRKADWISANGNLGTAKRDLNVAGVRIPAGTTFGEFNRNSVKLGKAGQAPARSYLEKYGQ